MIRIAILASGGGSNAEAIIGYFKSHNSIEVAMVLSNRKNAYVLKRAKNHNIDHDSFTREDLNDETKLLKLLKEKEIDYIILAGFLMLIPSILTQAYMNRILNIHPALLPKYGGKGMYGHHVHEAVKINGEKISGMTIHLVNEQYDKGRILFQAEVEILVNDSAEDIAAKVLKLEHKHYPQIIESYISERESR